MSKLLSLLVLSIVLATNAFAQSAVDSGKCPWKLPFTIKVEANGSQHNYQKQYVNSNLSTTEDYGTIYSKQSYEFTVDTSIEFLHRESSFSDTIDFVSLTFKEDTLLYFAWYRTN